MKHHPIIMGLMLSAALQTSALAADAHPGLKSTMVLKATESWDGKPIVLPQAKAEVTGIVMEIAPGAETGWHLHPAASFGYVMEGELEVHLKNGSMRKLKAGDALAEVVNVLHNGVNTGNAQVKIAVFYIGEAGQPLFVRENQDAAHTH